MHLLPRRFPTVAPALLLALTLLVTGCGAASEGEGTGQLIVRDLQSDPAALVAAETGRLARPALIFFHAAWCHVCTRVEPLVDEIVATHASDLALILLDVDDSAARQAVSRYRVQSTPTFVLIGADGTRLATLPGWPGEEMLARAIDELVGSTGRANR